MLLEPELRARLERLALRSRQRVRAQWSGRHLSKHKGESIDFADYREYTDGDDFRRIDHSLWARLGVLLVKQYEAEEELPVNVVLDVSKSMGFYGKFETARRLAAMVAYLGLAGGDRVQLFSVPELEAGPVGRHLATWPPLELWLEARSPTAVGGLAPALRRLAASPGRRGSLVIVSDLLSDDWRQALDGLVAGAGGLVLHVLADQELSPELAGDLRLVDGESGADVPFSTSAASLAAYRRSLEQFVEGAAGRTKRARSDYLLVRSGEGAAESVLSRLAEAAVVR